MANYMIKQEFIQKIKALLIEDLNSDGDVGPNGMLSIVKILEQYQGNVQQYTVDVVMEESRWLQTYFTHCRHMARPIDIVLATKIIDSFDYLP